MARSFEKKTCPRCGQLLYADMTVCYGCLYDFTRKDNGPSEPAAAKKIDAGGGAAAPSSPMSPGDGRVAAAPGAASAARPGSAPVEMADDNESTMVLDGPPANEVPHAVWVRAGSADVMVPLGEEGLCVGRGSGNQVVLREKSVSRRHLRVLPAEGGAEVRDLGSTNPAWYRGRPLRGSVVIPWGGEVELGGVVLSMCE